MPSGFIKILLSLTGVSPALLFLYIVKLYLQFDQLSIYIKFSSVAEAVNQVAIFLGVHYLLILFCAFVWLAYYIVSFAENHLAVGRIEVKSLKPVDNNFVSIVFSLIISFLKLYKPGVPDSIFLVAFFCLSLLLAFIFKASFHYNLVLKVIFGYKHYEIQTMKESGFLILSRRKIINRAHITKYVTLADHMLINVSHKK